MQQSKHPHSRIPVDRVIDDILKRPYVRAFAPDPQSGTYTAWIPEFPGCVTQGSTVSEALAHLEKAAHGWLAAALDLDQEIPEPVLEIEHNPWKALRRIDRD